jgi:hypothetical protein
MDESALSIRQQIKRCILNTTIGQWMRAIDAVLDEHTPRGGTIKEEADHVTKLALRLMLVRWYDEEDVCLILDADSLRLPHRLSESTRHDITRILDNKPDGDEPPGSHHDPNDTSAELFLTDD